MSMILTLLLAVQVISALSIIVLVLLQQGKGADMGSAFGGGSAGSLFGAAGAANFLSRATKWAAIVFFIVTGALAYFGQGARNVEPEIGIMEGYEEVDPAIPQAPDANDASIPSVPDADISVPEVSEVPDVPEANGADIPQAPAADSGNAAPSAANDTAPEVSIDVEVEETEADNGATEASNQP